MISELLYLIFGIVFVWLSAEILIRASQTISARFGISETFVGLTILSVGTSLPELGTHLVTSLDVLKGMDVSNLAVATNIGSNTIQIAVILLICNRGWGLYLLDHYQSPSGSLGYPWL